MYGGGPGGGRGGGRGRGRVGGRGSGSASASGSGCCCCCCLLFAVAVVVVVVAVAGVVVVVVVVSVVVDDDDDDDDDVLSHLRRMPCCAGFFRLTWPPARKPQELEVELFLSFFFGWLFFRCADHCLSMDLELTHLLGCPRKLVNG